MSNRVVCKECGKNKTRRKSGLCVECESKKNSSQIQGTLSKQAVRERIDWKYKIMQVASKLTEDEILEDKDMRTASGVPPQFYRAAAEDPDFNKYKGKGGQRIYWGHPKTIAEFKERHNMTEV